MADPNGIGRICFWLARWLFNILQTRTRFIAPVFVKWPRWFSSWGEKVSHEVKFPQKQIPPFSCRFQGNFGQIIRSCSNSVANFRQYLKLKILYFESCYNSCTIDYFCSWNWKQILVAFLFFIWLTFSHILINLTNQKVQMLFQIEISLIVQYRWKYLSFPLDLRDDIDFLRAEAWDWRNENDEIVERGKGEVTSSTRSELLDTLAVSGSAKPKELIVE